MLKFFFSGLVYCFILVSFGYAESLDDYLVSDKGYISKNQKQIQNIVIDITQKVQDADFQTQQSIIKEYYYILGVTLERLEAEMNYAGNVQRLWKSEVMKFARIDQHYGLHFYKTPSSQSVINEMAILDSNSEKIMFVKFENQWKVSK